MADEIAGDPIGTVRIEQHEGGHSAWQHVGGTPGNEWMCVWSSRGEEGCTLPPDGVAAFPVAGAVPGTPAAPVVDGSGVSVGGELRARCISALAEKPLEFISPDEFGGYDIHYAELVDIVLAEVQPVLAEADRCARRDRYTRDRWGAWWMEMREENKHRLDDAIQAGEEAEQLRAEIARLRGTNEALLAMLERMETLHVTWFGPDGEEYHPDWCRECRVDKVAAELADLESQRDAWWNQRAAELAEVRASREAWAIEAMRLDVELAERPTAWAYEQANQALEKRRVALVTALGGSRPGQGFYDAVDDVEGLVGERAVLSRMLRGMARRATVLRRERAGLLTTPEPMIPAPELTPEQVEELTAEFEAAMQRGDHPRVLISSDLVAQYRHLLGCIWLYVDWRWLTRQLTTVQKELWADAVDAFGDPAEEGPKAERWWRSGDVQEGHRS